MAVRNEIDLKRKEELEAIEKLCLLDDNLMTVVFDRNIEATEFLLNIISFYFLFYLYYLLQYLFV